MLKLNPQHYITVLLFRLIHFYFKRLPLYEINKINRYIYLEVDLHIIINNFF